MGESDSTACSDLVLRTAQVNVGLEGLVFQVAGGYNLYNREGANAGFIFGTRDLELSSDRPWVWFFDSKRLSIGYLR